MFSCLNHCEHTHTHTHCSTHTHTHTRDHSYHKNVVPLVVSSFNRCDVIKHSHSNLFTSFNLLTHTHAHTHTSRGCWQMKPPPLFYFLFWTGFTASQGSWNVLQTITSNSNWRNDLKFSRTFLCDDCTLLLDDTLKETSKSSLTSRHSQAQIACWSFII